MGSEPIDALLDREARRLVAALAARSATLSTAESLTAGMVSSTVAGVPGASAVLRGGAVTYVNEVKERVLGVSARSIAEHTEVSHEVAREMAAGSRRLFGSDVAVSLTGYAGPGGGTEENPVGTVYIGVASAAGTESFRRTFAGDRARVRAEATLVALGLALARVDSMEIG